MLWAIISDIHANREALDAVFESIESKNADKIICLGDIVGYGADPDYCVEQVRRRADITVIGNHDHAALGLTPTYYFNPYAKAAAIWTADNLKKENAKFLKKLKFKVVLDNTLLVHSTPSRPENWNYVFSRAEAMWQFAKFEQDVCFIGHSHIPAMFKEEGDERRIINVGSVGQPRDHDPRACYFLWESERNQGDWMRVEYDIDSAADKIRKAGLPETLADRLYQGM